MRRFCKHIDITDYSTIRPFVEDCIFRHYKRHDFKKFLFEHGLKRKYYYFKLLKCHDKSCLRSTINTITRHVVRILNNENLDELTPVSIRTKEDASCGKTREIGCEGPLQQILDFIAVGGAKELFDKRIVKQQCASIPKRGQKYGVKMIQKYVRKDNRQISYKKKHGYFYTQKMKYFVKLDIQKCFPSMRLEVFMRFFRKDCANRKLCWLWENLLKSHKVDNDHQGFMIGSLVSQWAAQYLISFVYRFAMNIRSKRRSKNFVSHTVIFMDDILLTGGCRNDLLSAVKLLRKYVYNNLKLNTKPNFNIRSFENSVGIDMMGFVVYRNGKISIRAKTFIKMRRLYLRYKKQNLNLSVRQSRRHTSYKGFYKLSNTKQLDKEYKIIYSFNRAAFVVSRNDKQINQAERSAA